MTRITSPSRSDDTTLKTVPASAQTSGPRTLSRLALGAMLLFTGAGHLSFLRRQFVAQVPESLPLDPDFVVVSSGYVELGLATALITAPPLARVPMGLIAAAFFVAVFPGNISQYQTRRSGLGLDTDGKRFARLFLQPVLVWWALWGTGADEPMRQRGRDGRTPTPATYLAS